MDRKSHNGVLDKTKEIYEQYCQTLCDGRSNDNSRQIWQRLVHHNRITGASMDTFDHPWPWFVLKEIGYFLYLTLLQDVKIDTNIMLSDSKETNLVHAFDTTFRTESNVTFQDIEPHPVLKEYNNSTFE